MRRAVSALLVALLAAPPASLNSAPALGRVEGTVTLAGQPLAGVEVALIDIESGAVHRKRTAVTGSFALRLPAGRYAVTTENAAGLVVGRAPRLLAVQGGQVASARIDLLALPTAILQEPEAQGATVSIQYEPVGCMLEGEFPLFEASIEPATSVARARLFFRAASGSEFLYVELVPSGGLFVGRLPRPTLAASPVTSFLQATGTDGADVQTPETESLVVTDPSQCPEGAKMAAIGPPGEVTVYSAASGTVVKPVGFAAGGLALTVGTIALLVGGATALGVTAALTVFNPSPTPAPTPTPIPSPTPEPTPEPTPSPSPSPTATPPAPTTPFR